MSHDASIAKTEQPDIIHHVFAMQRSGHHAVINWLQGCYAQAGQDSVHVNDVYHGHVESITVSDPTPQEVLAQGLGAAVLLINYEDIALSQKNSSVVYRTLQSSQTDSSVSDIVIIRDWYNMAASRLKSIELAMCRREPLQLHRLGWAALAEAWKSHARAALQADLSLHFVQYNQWLTDPAYRVRKAQDFGLANSDSSLLTVPKFGNGSSFDGLAYDGTGSSMNVLRRWDNLPPQCVGELLAVSDDPEINELNVILFGFGHTDVSRAVGSCQ